MNHDYVLNCYVIKLHQPGNRATRVIHECAGLGKNDLWATKTESAFGNGGVGLVGFETRRNAIGQDVENHLAYVVTIGSVIGPGVTEPDYEPCRIRHVRN